VYGSPSNDRQTVNRSVLDIEAKVGFPIVAARVKQASPLTGIRIDRIDRVALEEIAGSAGKCQIVFRVVPATVRWNDVFDFEGEIENYFGGSAVLTAMSRPSGHGLVTWVHPHNPSAISDARRAVASNSAATSESSSVRSASDNNSP